MIKASASCPAILVSGPASGQGKTTVTVALARLHARQGRRVRIFKCGPDFLDPQWHALASGGPVYQLDLWMSGEADCSARLHQAALEADLIIIEGVMGLFDGQPSSADLARRFRVPVLAVIDAFAMAGTFGALAYGLQHYQDGLQWAGVLANRVVGERHADMLCAGLGDKRYWLGALFHDTSFQLPERHLGLTAPLEVKDAMARLDAVADALATTPLGQLDKEGLSRWSVDFPAPENIKRAAPLLNGVSIAIARDEAFCFIYDANIDALRVLGAHLTFFSPLADPSLPPCDAVWLPGGYPELHALRLNTNHSMRASLVSHKAAGRPIWAECGGMMALFDELVTVDGARYPMWGLLPGTVTMQKRMAALGPQQLIIGGECLRGHSFHYSSCVSSMEPIVRTTSPGKALHAGEGEVVYRHGSVQASYFHAWFPSSLKACASLFLQKGAA